MNDRKWYQKSLYRLLVDMHIPDWNERFLKDFSPDVYAENMVLAGIDTAEIYASSCLGLCYWPTKVGFQHQQLHGRDLLGETVEACRRRGLGIQIYMNVWNRAAYDAHPEWRIVQEDGRTTCENPGNRYGQCCHNTGYREFVMGMLKELNDSYDCQGFWVDMCMLYRHCYCPFCQARFRAETGYDHIPRIADWNDSAWLSYENCRERWIGEFIQKLREVVVSTHPERSVTFQSASMARGRDSGVGPAVLQAGDYLAGDFTGGRIEQSFICKSYSMFSANRPMEFMTPRCENLSHHTTERSRENLRMRAYAAVANQASFTLIDAIDPEGTMDRRFYEHAHEIGQVYKPYEPFIDPESRPCFDIGIYASIPSQYGHDQAPARVSLFENSPSGEFWKTNANLVDTFQKNHRLFAFVQAKDKDSLKGIPLLVLSDCSNLDERECQAITECVREGGKVYASYLTSLVDDRTGLLKDFRLAELFGVHYAGGRTGSCNYIAPTGVVSIPGLTEAYPVMLESPQVEITAAPDAEVLGVCVMPISDPTEIYRFGSAISNPPLLRSGRPAMVRHKFGKGEVLYVAGRLESVSLDFHQKVLDFLLMNLLGEPPMLETNAPACVECTLFERPDEKDYLLSCLNLPLELPALPLFKLEFRLRLPQGRVAKAVTLGAEKLPHPFRQEGDTLVLELESMHEFALFSIQY